MKFEDKEKAKYKLYVASSHVDRAKSQLTFVDEAQEENLRHHLADYCAYEVCYALTVFVNAVFTFFGRDDAGDIRLLRDQLSNVDSILAAHGLEKLAINGLATIDAGVALNWTPKTRPVT